MKLLPKFLNKSDDQIHCNNIYICPVSLRCRKIASKLVLLQHINCRYLQIL